MTIFTRTYIYITSVYISIGADQNLPFSCCVYILYFTCVPHIYSYVHNTFYIHDLYIYIIHLLIYITIGDSISIRGDQNLPFSCCIYILYFTYYILHAYHTFTHMYTTHVIIYPIGPIKICVYILYFTCVLHIYSYVHNTLICTQHTCVYILYFTCVLYIYSYVHNTRDHISNRADPSGYSFIYTLCVCS